MTSHAIHYLDTQDLGPDTIRAPDASDRGCSRRRTGGTHAHGCSRARHWE